MKFDKRNARYYSRKAVAARRRKREQAETPVGLPLSGNILDTMALVGDQFVGESWASWRAFLKALFALSPEPQEHQVFVRHTSRQTAPTAPFRESWVVAGRRGGKSRIAALVAVYLATRDYSAVLAPGETGTVMLLASDRTQAGVCFRYICGLLEAAPELRALVVKPLKESVLLANRVEVAVRTAHFGRVRGHTVLAAVCDEIGFWVGDDGGANPDKEVVAALRPAMATVPSSLLLAISTPWGRKGALFEAYQRWYGQDDAAVLIWQADTRSMNPTVPATVIDRAYVDDPEAAAAEYGAQFRSDLETLFMREALAVVTVPGRIELASKPGTRYAGFVDASGGGADSFAMAVAHEEADRMVLDLVRERRPPFSPDAVVAEFVATLRAYGVTAVSGDRYGAEGVAERFRVHGVQYRPAERTKSQLYSELLPLVNAGKVELLDVRRLTGQLLALERRTSRAGQDSIDHPPRGHDDVANAAAGALACVATGRAPSAGYLFNTETGRIIEQYRGPDGRIWVRDAPPPGLSMGSDQAWPSPFEVKIR